MKIAFISVFDVHNRTARSGVPYSIYHQLSKTEDVDWINPADSYIYKIGFFFYRCFQKLHKLFGYSINNNTAYMSRLIAWSINSKLKQGQYDAIFSMLHFELVFLDTKIPCYTRTDTIFKSATEILGASYPKWFINHSYELENKALNKLTCLFAASQWMEDEAFRWFPDLSKEKVKFIETGANLDRDYIKYDDRVYGIDKPLRMLFVGYDIKKKGLDIAFETMRILRDKYHLDITLCAIGGKPYDYMMNDKSFRYVGMLDKNIKTEYDQFYKEFANSNLFLFPTKNEYHGIVNCEAAAYALPIYSHDTCGVSSYVINHENGRTLPLGSAPDTFAEAIFCDLKENNMQIYSFNSRRLYEERFNWNVWCEKVLDVINKNRPNRTIRK